MKYKKIIIFAILVILTVPVCLYIVGIVHFTITNQFTSISDMKLNIILDSVINEKQCQKLYLLTQVLITLFLFFATFIQKENIYESKLEKITNNIRTPLVAGQGQYGTARWLQPKEFETTFKKIILDSKENIKNQDFSSAGLVVGYKKLKKGKEEIYCVDTDTHSLTVGATRSGKSRTIVLETIATLGVAGANNKNGGESIICSDPKGELYHYTSKFMEELGYETIVIDFKNPLKSNRYNFLQPIIDSVNTGDYRKAEEYAWDITQALVGDEESKMERIWKDGEMSIIAGTIMAVVYENIEYPEFQNLTNVYTFISEMCRSEDGEMPINDYINDLNPENPASRIFNIARIAPDKTRGSFFTSALATLKLFTSDSIYSMTCESDFNLKDTGNKNRIIYIILPDERLSYYPIASLFVNQQYVALVENSEDRGGELKCRVNFVLDEFRKFYEYTCFFQYVNSTVEGEKLDLIYFYRVLHN